MIALLTLLTAGPVFVTAAYLWRLSWRVVAARRYPPADLRVLREVPVLDGVAAIRAGRFMQALAVVLALAAVLLAYFLWRFASTLTTG